MKCEFPVVKSKKRIILTRALTIITIPEVYLPFLHVSARGFITEDYYTRAFALLFMEVTIKTRRFSVAQAGISTRLALRNRSRICGRLGCYFESEILTTIR